MSDAAEDLLKRAGCSRGVVVHCRRVRESAGRFITPCTDRELVLCGAMLHDIGRARTHTIGHGQVGAGIARSFGLREEIA
ncbi:MAG: HDIG domain-containing protein, partial [Methanomicrobiales archaeon]|nr:HDIG domain-containing protein [Methanomicrobiales archaeon]